jgi:hypothetical protein
MSAKHTPGQHSVVQVDHLGSPAYAVKAADDLIAVGCLHGDARLFAAAPELLEAAKLAMEGDEVLGLLIAAIKKHGNYSQMSTIHFLNQARCARLRLTEAIAKAEGTP